MAADPAVQLDRVALTATQLRATEIMLYRSADLIDRLLKDNHIPYTKMQVSVPYPTSVPVAGQLPQAPMPTAEQIAPRSPSVLRGG